MGEDDCKKAAKYLGLEYKAAYNGKGHFRSCFFTDDERSEVYFNKAGTGALATPYADSICAALCKQESFYKESNGKYCTDEQDLKTEDDCKKAAKYLGLEYK